MSDELGYIPLPEAVVEQGQSGDHRISAPADNGLIRRSMPDTLPLATEPNTISRPPDGARRSRRTARFDVRDLRLLPRPSWLLVACHRARSSPRSGS